MAQTQGLPKSFVPDEPDVESSREPNLPASFEPDVRHGASGSWAEATPTEQFQVDHPLLSAPVTALARFGKGAVDAVGAFKDAFTKPAQPGEEKFVGYGGPFGLAASRLFIQPHLQQIEKAQTAPTLSERFGHTLAASIPMIGPFAAGLTEQMLSGEVPEALGGLAAGYVLPKAGGEVLGMRRGGPKLGAPPSESSISAASTMIESGVKNDLVNSYAEQSIPIWKQAAAELGKTAEQFPARTGRGEAGKRAVRTGGEHAIQIADHAVEIADRPFQDVLRNYGKSTIERPGVPEHLTVKGRILGELDTAIAENANNPALARAIKELRGRVEKAKTFNDLQSLKVLANKKGSALFDKSLGQQINASADAAYSWKVLGDTIRAEMYPELSNLSGIDLSKAGRLEGIVMDARDGLRKHFYTDVLNPHNKRMQQNYWQYVRDGGSLARRSLVKRMFLVEPTPAGMFNQRFQQVMGGEFPAPTGMPPARPPAPLAPQTLAGAAQDLVPFTAPPELNAPGQLNLFSAPAGATSRGIGEGIFGVQQRAAREARMAPPPTLAGAGQELLPSGGPGLFAAPSTPVSGNPHLDYLTQLRQQAAYRAGAPVPEKGQLSLMRGMAESAAPESTMGIRQTPIRFNPTKRETYTMADLRSMVDEINAFIRNNPSHPQVTELMRDVEAVRHELNRRVEAHKTPGSKRKD